MNKTLKKFCEVEHRALSFYKEKYRPKDEMYHLLLSEFGKRYESVLLIGLESAAEANNFHKDSGPWSRDLRQLIGYYTFDELFSARQKVKTDYYAKTTFD